MGVYDTAGNIIRTRDMAAAMPMRGTNGEITLADRFNDLLDDYFNVR